MHLIYSTQPEHIEAQNQNTYLHCEGKSVSQIAAAGIWKPIDIVFYFECLCVYVWECIISSNMKSESLISMLFWQHLNSLGHGIMSSLVENDNHTHISTSTHNQIQNHID